MTCTIIRLEQVNLDQMSLRESYVFMCKRMPSHPGEVCL